MRKLYEIAGDIRRDWRKVNFGAMPYLEAMSSLETVEDAYYHDSAKSIIAYFLVNSGSWKGETARAIKSELKSMIK